MAVLLRLLLARMLAILVAASSILACAGPARPWVSLAQEHTPDTARSADEARAGDEPLRVAVASVLSPKATFRSYQDLVSYIRRRAGRRVEFIQRSTYGEMNALLRTGGVDLAFVCTLAYVEAARELTAELLVTPVVRGRAEYWSDLIVPAGSPATSLSDLRGAVFAFTDPLSTTGALVPTYELWRSGATPGSFFKRVIYTYSHDNSIRAVADALVDGATVDSLVYDSTVAQEPGLERRVRVLGRYGPFAAPPVVVNPRLAPERKDMLRAILLGMTEDAEGAGVLAELGIDRFVVLDDAAYDGVRRMRDALAAAGLFRP